MKGVKIDVAAGAKNDDIIPLFKPRCVQIFAQAAVALEGH